MIEQSINVDITGLDAQLQRILEQRIEEHTQQSALKLYFEFDRAEGELKAKISA